MKVNKLPKCHNPHKSLTPQRLFAAKSLLQLDSIFCLHSITVVTLSKPIYFVVLKRSRTEKSPWIKSKTKPGPNKKKGLWLNQLSENEAASASSLDISTVSNGSEENRRKQCYERTTSKNKPGLFFTVGFSIVRNECLLETTLRHLLLSLFCFVEVQCTFFSFRFILY